jgi:hypothetical protein
MRTLILALAALLAACSSIRVGVDRDPDYAFATQRTYAWKEGVPADSALHQKRIEEGVDRALAERGLQRTDSPAPDLWVATEVESHQEVRSTGSSVGVGVGHGFHWGGVGFGTSSGNELYEVKVGSLVVAVLDVPSEELVWRAEAEDVLTTDPERTADRIREAIEAAFDEFPRAASGG